MHIINTTPLEEGVYNDHKADLITTPPEGWAMIPEDMTLPSTFPRLGSLKTEYITYTYNIEVEKDVVKTRDVEVINEDGEVEVIKEEYTEKETVVEQCEKVMLTVVEMTEGTLPESVEPEEPINIEQLRADIDYIAVMTGVEL